MPDPDLCERRGRSESSRAAGEAPECDDPIGYRRQLPRLQHGGILWATDRL